MNTHIWVADVAQSVRRIGGIAQSIGKFVAPPHQAECVHVHLLYCPVIGAKETGGAVELTRCQLS